MTHTDPRAAALIAHYETLTLAGLDALVDLYAEDCRFKDPFNEVSGRAALRRVFAHMFETVKSPRFVVHEALVEGEQCFLGWDFHAGGLVIRGASHLRFDAAGLVVAHRDYWDAAEELYEKLPLLGALMRWLKRRLRRNRRTGRTRPAGSQRQGLVLSRSWQYLLVWWLGSHAAPAKRRGSNCERSNSGSMAPCSR